MIDAAQSVLLFVIVILTLLLIVIGVQVFFILKELRRTVLKANKVLDDTSSITESVSRPLSSLSTLSTGLKTGAIIAKLIKGFKKSTKDLDDGDESGK